jgi:hypothetical protein
MGRRVCVRRAYWPVTPTHRQEPSELNSDNLAVPGQALARRLGALRCAGYKLLGKQ